MFEITLFGTTSVRSAPGHRPARLPASAPRRVLEMICLAGGATVSADRLADQLWEGRPPRSGAATLTAHVAVLRRALQPGVPGRATVVRTAPGGYRLDTDRVDLDLVRFDRARAAAAAARGREALARWEEAAFLGARPVLAHEPYAAWAADARRAYRRSAVGAAVSGAQVALDLGEADRAALLARTAVDLDPLEEDGWRLLIVAHGIRNRPVAAARAFGECRAALLGELGLHPGPGTRSALRSALDTRGPVHGELVI
ncbi:AfsR/SARP family transcriptional regulator [Pseudonocardia alni]|uniref:AfsR/SARP family transcriptional regulator n=1 Tax=Pseudonocardia alni TaxID=33907 RepID=UPI00332C0076